MIYLNKKGFTMIEVILVLCILTVIASLLPLVIRSISPPKETSVNPHELALFFQQIGAEIRGAKSAQVQSNNLYLLLPSGSLISYEQAGNKIIRKVDGEGYELVLQNVSVFESLLKMNRIAIYVSDQKNFTFNRSFIMYIQKYQGETL
jgi:competence protein ComGF